jgi:hypothetical protein
MDKLASNQALAQSDFCSVFFCLLYYLFSKPFGINLSIRTYDPQHTNKHPPCELARPIASRRHRRRRCRRPPVLESSSAAQT